jgi:phosphohistidine phosphatase SixA
MQTAHIVAEELGFGNEIELNDALRPDSSFDDFEQMVREYSKAKAIIVTGHNPNFSEFLSLVVTNGSKEDAFDLKKGGFAKVERRKQSAVLHWCLTPKLIGAAQELTTTSSRPNTSRK